MRRAYLVAVIAAGVVVFLAISAILARALSVDGAERSAITSLIEAQARGDTDAMVAQVFDCRTSSACRARVAYNTAHLTRPGSISIIQVQPSAGFSLTATLGTARVAWNAGSSLPIVQCVRVRRAGNVLSGLHVELLEISRRIPSDQSCPARY